MRRPGPLQGDPGPELILAVRTLLDSSQYEVPTTVHRGSPTDPGPTGSTGHGGPSGRGGAGKPNENEKPTFGPCLNPPCVGQTRRSGALDRESDSTFESITRTTRVIPVDPMIRSPHDGERQGLSWEGQFVDAVMAIGPCSDVRSRPSRVILLLA